MKFLEIFSFEFNYRKRRAVTYIYFLVVLVATIFAMNSKVTTLFGASQFVKANSPMIIAKMMSALSLVFVFITSAVMGVSVLRDFEHKTASLIFITPTKKWQYLLGRFLGSFAVLLFIFVGLLLGCIIAEFIPGRVPDTLHTFSLQAYLVPFFIIVLPNVFITAVLFFMAGTLSRSMLFVYVQGITLFLAYLILDEGVFEVMNNKTLASLLDPMGLHTLINHSEQWTVAQQNQYTVGLAGMIGANRLLWLGVAAVVGFITYHKFKFELVNKKTSRKPSRSRQLFKFQLFSKKSTPQVDTLPTSQVVIAADGLAKNFYQVMKQSLFYAKMVARETPFRLIMLGVVAFLAVASLNIGRTYAGLSTYPFTYLVLEAFGRLSIFFLTIIIFYSGELIWKERSCYFDAIYDALPTRSYVNLLSKILGMIWVFVGVFLFLIFVGVIIQSNSEYYQHEFPLYFQVLFTQNLFFVVWFSVLAFAIQVLVNQKFLAYLLTFLVFALTSLADVMGLEHGLWQYGKVSLGMYSDMSGFSGSTTSFVSYSVYWFSLAIVLLIVAVLGFVRGREASLKTRVAIARQRWGKPLMYTTIVSVLFFGCSGFYIYYNTNVLNQFESRKAKHDLQARYERELKQFEDISQPVITDIKMVMDIFPEKHQYIAKGTYTLKNLTNKAIRQIHIQHNRFLSQHLALSQVKFSQEATLSQSFAGLYYSIYTLKKPLQPNEQLHMSFVTSFKPKGFVEKPGEIYHTVVKNGTFVDNGHFPMLGYSDMFELVNTKIRKKYGLSAQPTKPHTTHQHSIMGDDAYKVNLDVTLSTSGDQTAIAPGYLQKHWTKAGRNYYHYTMDKPIEHFYSIVSARYEVMRDTVMIDSNGKAKKIDLAIYYMPQHQYNLGSMMKSMKHSLRYFSREFSPYQYRQLRIMEFPRYASFAQAFANTVPFSEGVGFGFDQRQAIDVAFKVTAHEVGHQWWGHQVMAAHGVGAGMVLESLAQYSSLMVMKHYTNLEKLKEYNDFEHRRYFKGRTRLKEPEVALSQANVEQNYLQYGKGAVNMYALQHYIGESQVNKALRQFIRQTQAKQKGEVVYYPTAQELVKCFRAVTPDSLQGFVTDLFDKMIVFDNKTHTAQVRKEGKHYVVDLDIRVKKLEQDSKGIEKSIAPNDWVDIGIYAPNAQGKEELVYFKKHKITANQTKVSVKVSQKPSRAGVDPLNILLDKQWLDNVVKVTQ